MKITITHIESTREFVAPNGERSELTFKAMVEGDPGDLEVRLAAITLSVQTDLALLESARVTGLVSNALFQERVATVQDQYRKALAFYGQKIQ